MIYLRDSFTDCISGEKVKLFRHAVTVEQYLATSRWSLFRVKR